MDLIIGWTLIAGAVGAIIGLSVWVLRRLRSPQVEHPTLWLGASIDTPPRLRQEPAPRFASSWAPCRSMRDRRTKDIPDRVASISIGP